MCYNWPLMTLNWPSRHQHSSCNVYVNVHFGGPEDLLLAEKVQWLYSEGKNVSGNFTFHKRQHLWQAPWHALIYLYIYIRAHPKRVWVHMCCVPVFSNDFNIVFQRPFHFPPPIVPAGHVLHYESVAHALNTWNLISGPQQINTWHHLFTYWTEFSTNPITALNTKSMKLRKHLIGN